MNIPINQLEKAQDLPLPSYSHEGDAGLDLRTVKDITLEPGERATIPTGVAIAIPQGYAGHVWDKSGLAFKHGLTTLGGVVDATYRGEVMVCMLNTSDTPYSLKRGDKVAQLVIQPVAGAEIEQVETLDDTPRGDSGFGSTGRK